MAEAVLRKLRTRLGFQSAEVAAAGGWSRSEFTEIEKSGELDVEQGLLLTDLYGVDVQGVLGEGVVRKADLPMAALLKGNASSLTADARFAMTAAVAAARDIRELEECLNAASVHDVNEFSEDRNLGPAKFGHHTKLAARLREKLSLSWEIKSMTSELLTPLGVLVFGANFRDRSIDAFSHWSPTTGPLIVVNSSCSKQPLGLRTALAHELCHLLFDRRKMRDITTFCEFERPRHSAWSAETESIEVRARAFQVELLAPQKLVHAAWMELGRPAASAAIPALCARFGIGPVAMSWQLCNAGGPKYDGRIAPLIAPDRLWPESAEIFGSAESPSVPGMRRGRLLQLVRGGIESGDVSASWGRELLRQDLSDWEELLRAWG